MYFFPTNLSKLVCLVNVFKTLLLVWFSCFWIFWIDQGPWFKQQSHEDLAWFVLAFEGHRQIENTLGLKFVYEFNNCISSQFQDIFWNWIWGLVQVKVFSKYILQIVRISKCNFKTTLAQLWINCLHLHSTPLRNKLLCQLFKALR